MKATFEATKQTGKKVYYQFEGTPAQSVIDKLYEYSERYGIEVVMVVQNIFNIIQVGDTMESCRITKFPRDQMELEDIL